MKNSIKWYPKPADVKELESAATLIQSFVSNDTARRSHNKGYYIWKLNNNPFGLGKMWIIKDKCQIVGTVSFTPKRLYINGILNQGVELCDGFTHPEYQKQGIFSTLLNMTSYNPIDGEIAFIYGTPNEQALPVEKKAGYRVIPSA